MTKKEFLSFFSLLLMFSTLQAAEQELCDDSCKKCVSGNLKKCETCAVTYKPTEKENDPDYPTGCKPDKELENFLLIALLVIFCCVVPLLLCLIGAIVGSYFLFFRKKKTKEEKSKNQNLGNGSGVFSPDKNFDDMKRKSQITVGNSEGRRLEYIDDGVDFEAEKNQGDKGNNFDFKKTNTLGANKVQIDGDDHTNTKGRANPAIHRGNTSGAGLFSNLFSL